MADYLWLIFIAEIAEKCQIYGSAIFIAELRASITSGNSFGVPYLSRALFRRCFQRPSQSLSNVPENQLHAIARNNETNDMHLSNFFS